jgi:hypothetical protein
MATKSQNMTDPHLSSAFATIPMPKAIMPTEIKYAVRLSMLDQAGVATFRSPETRRPSGNPRHSKQQTD